MTANILPNHVLFHPDGPGFYHVEELSHSDNVRNTLVRSNAGGGLFVRREKTSTEPGDITVDACAITVGSRLHTLPNAVADAMRGWATYRSSTDHVARVSYWKWFNAGTMHGMLNHLRSAGTHVPEIVLWHIFKTLYTTVKDLHKEHGVSPRNAHSLNWVIDVQDETYAIPAIGLQNYDAAMLLWGPLKDENASQWTDSCNGDWQNIAEIIRNLSLTVMHSTTLSEQEKTTMVSQYSSDFTDRLYDLENPDAASLARVEHHLSSMTPSDSNALLLAYTSIGVQALLRDPPPYRPFTDVLQDFAQDPSRRPIKYLVGRVDERRNKVLFVQPSNLYDSVVTTYRNITAMDKVPLGWAANQIAMAQLLKIDPFEI